MADAAVVAKNADTVATQATGKIVPVDNAGAGGTSDHPNASPGKFHPTTIFLYFLGINLTISGNATSWNLGLSAGLQSYVVMYFVMAVAYLTFCLCISEVTSALPFAGGAFGLARCTLGFFPAFMIGCCETLEYVASVAFQAICAIDVIAMAAPSLEGSKPLLWLLYFIPTTVIQCLGGLSFWVGILVLGVTELFLILLHNFGSLGFVDYSVNAAPDPLVHATGGFDEAMRVFPYFAWLFLGVEAINLASDDVLRPKQQIPIAQTACIATLFCVGIFTSMTCVSLPMEGGMEAVMTAYTPLANGFSRILKIDPQVASILIMPSEYAGAYGLQWASAKLIHAMGESRLLPPWMGVKSERFGTPHVAIMISSILGYATCLLVFYIPSVTAYVLPLCLLFAFCSYAGQCIGYISLRMNFPIVRQSKFRNPFGIYGAVYAVCVWFMGVVAVLGFQGHHGIEALLFLGLLLVLAVYYVLFAKKRQIMSEEETKILLVAHISRFNKKRKSRGGSRLSKRLSRVSSSGAPGRLVRMFSSKNTTKYKTESSTKSIHT